MQDMFDRDGIGWRILMIGGLIGLLLVAVTFVAVVLPRLGQAEVEAYPTSTAPDDFFGRVYLRTRVEAIPRIQAEDLEGASRAVEFTVRLPSYTLEDLAPVTFSDLSFNGAHAYQVTVDYDSAREILRAGGLPTDFLPADARSPQFRVTVPPSAVLYESAPDGRWFTLIQGRNPLIVEPPGYNPEPLRRLQELGLQSLGLSAEAAADLTERMNWAALLVVPTAELTDAESVTVNGQPGMALHTSLTGADRRAVIWEAGGVLYGLYGTAPVDQLLRMAESLE